MCCSFREGGTVRPREPTNKMAQEFMRRHGPGAKYLPTGEAVVFSSFIS